MSITSAKSGATGISLALDNNYMEPIASALVGAGGTGAIVFNDIPQTYKHLQIRCHSQGSYSATDYDNVSMYFNGDTGNNYTYHNLRSNGSNVSVGSLTDYNRLIAQYTHVAPSNDNIFGISIIDILDYANNTKNKTMRSLGAADSNGAGGAGLSGGMWMSTAPVTSITIFENNSPYTWNQYSRFSLYGIKE
jgi:hypothetical protein